MWRNWQTRMVQVHVLAREWRFKSSHPHQHFKGFDEIATPKKWPPFVSFRGECRVDRRPPRVGGGTAKGWQRQHLTESFLLAATELADGLCAAALVKAMLPSLLAEDGEVPLIDLASTQDFS